MADAERRGRGRLVLLGFALAALLVAGFGIVSRVRARTALSEDAKKTAAPFVSVFVPERGAPRQELILPGTAQAFTDAPIYARTAGYLRKWYADIGARVRKGQLLAEIDSPEIEQQLQAAKADLKVIFSSGYSSDFGTESAPLPEGCAFLAKPYKPEVLVRAVRNCLDN